MSGSPLPAEEGGRPAMVRPHVYTCPEGSEWRCADGVLEARVEKDEEGDEESIEFPDRGSVEFEERFSSGAFDGDNDGWLAFLAKNYPECVAPARAAIADPMTRAEADADDARRLFPLAFPASVVSSEEGGRGVDGHCPHGFLNAHCEACAASVVGDASEGEADALLIEVQDWLADTHRFDAKFAARAATYCANLLASLRSTRAALEEARTDAENWRALMSIARFRMLGCAGLDNPVPGDAYAHIGLELWTQHLRPGDDALDRDYFARFVGVAKLARAIPSQESEKV